jgi:hypothetical protein
MELSQVFFIQRFTVTPSYFFAAGIWGPREEKDGEVVKRQQETGEAEERTDNGFQETAKDD